MGENRQNNSRMNVNRIFQTPHVKSSRGRGKALRKVSLLVAHRFVSPWLSEKICSRYSQRLQGDTYLYIKRASTPYLNCSDRGKKKNQVAQVCLRCYIICPER